MLSHGQPSMRDFSAYDHIGGFAGPVLILQGDKDGIVPISVAQRASEKYKNAELVILRDEGHGFTPAGVQISMEKTLQMMKRSIEQ